MASRSTPRTFAFALLFVVLGAAVSPPAAAAEPLRANVVSVSPNDIDQPDVPVSIVFQLYKPELPSAYPKWGMPIGGVNDVEVVIRGQGQTRRFRTEDLTGGRYRTEIASPSLAAGISVSVTAPAATAPVAKSSWARVRSASRRTALEHGPESPRQPRVAAGRGR